jgi:hypothetical protein
MNAAAGWYPDPGDPHVTRYWDGTRYTHERHWNGTAWVDPAAAPPPPPTAVAPTPVAPTPAAAAAPVSPMTAPEAAIPIAPTPRAYAPPVATPAAYPDPGTPSSPTPAPPHTAGPTPAAPGPGPASTFNAQTLRGLPRDVWLLIGGAAAVALSAFLPWVSVGGLVSGSPTGGGILVFLGSGGGIAALAWPTIQGQVLSQGRRWGIVALVALVWLFVLIIWGALVSHSNSFVSAGVGLFLCTIGAVAITIGIVRAWRAASATA